MFFGCDSPKFDHISYKNRRFVDLDCNTDCACGQQTFQPGMNQMNNLTILFSKQQKLIAIVIFFHQSVHQMVKQTFFRLVSLAAMLTIQFMIV